MTIRHRSAHFDLDKRGNGLVEYEVSKSKTSSSVVVRTAPEVVNHILRAWPRSQQLKFSETQTYWTHRIRFDFPYHEDMKKFLDLLKKILVLEIRRYSHIDGAIALDIYQRQRNDDPGSLQRTCVGQSIHTIKYGNESAAAAEAHLRLNSFLSETVRTHPWYERATRIIPTPPHVDTHEADVSLQIASRLSAELNIPILRAEPKEKQRKSVKEMSNQERNRMLREFRVRESLQGETVLILDDYYQTGKTMAGVSTAARQAGAGTVLGLAVTRNNSY